MKAGILRVGLPLWALGLAGLVIGMIGEAVSRTPPISIINELCTCRPSPYKATPSRSMISPPAT